MEFPAVAPRRVTMVKKILAGGEPCAKCAQAEDMLRRRELWHRIDRVVIADERDDASEGMQLARQYNVALAPFFLVEPLGEPAGPAGEVQVLTSVIKLAKLLEQPAAETSASPNRWTRADVEDLNRELSGATPQAIVERVLRHLGRELKIAFSGAEDVVLIDMASRSGLPFSVFCLDTGRLHPETYRFIDKVRAHYGIEIEITSPNYVELEALVRQKGLFSFYQDGHSECCGIRKVAPLRRALANAVGWMTGQRRDQSPTRANVPVLLWDESHVPGGIVKANPLAETSLGQVWQYITEHDVPFNELHQRGYISIGCEPCTRAVRPGEHERSGRFWWEDATRRECGLHAGK
jgi:phosphoadenosine phosphosulfate reductase